MKIKDRMGQRIGRFVIHSYSHKEVKNKIIHYWNAVCDCGNDFLIGTNVIHQNKSCGCLRTETLSKSKTKHGECRLKKQSVEYRTWYAMQSRCYNVNSKKFSIYGGRGIKVCDRWRMGFENFLDDMGRRPENCNSIDRINVNGDYEPSNCRWSNSIEQSNNRTSNVILEHDGVELNMKQWAEKLEVKYKWLQFQIKYKDKQIKDIIHGRLSNSI